MIKSINMSLLLAATLSAGVGAGAETSRTGAASASGERQGLAISWDQLGAKAGQQYSGDGLSVTATAAGAKLRCIFQKMEGEATAQGLWLTSAVKEGAGERFRVRAVAYGRMGASMTVLSDTGAVRVAEGVARWERTGLAEEYSVSMDGVRQDFIVAIPPAGEGPLRVVLRVDGVSIAAAPHGATLTLDGSARAIAYSRLRITDATGRELSGRMEIANGRLAVVVEDARAAYPIRIDPTFSDANWVSMNPAISSTDGDVLASAVDANGVVYMGGSFTVIANISASRIVRWDGSAWRALGSGVGGIVQALAMDGEGNLYAAGDFITAGDVFANRVAKWDGNAWSALGAGVGSTVFALAIDGDDHLVAGGSFTNAGAVTVNRVAKWDGSEWSALGSGLGNYVYALAVDGVGNLYTGGVFTNAGSVGVKRIAKWDGSAWSALGSGMNASVSALTTDSNGNLYVGGAFTNAGGVAASRVAKWDGNAWSALGSGVGSTVSALSTDGGGNLYVGGDFTNAGAVAVTRIARWNNGVWSALDSGMNALVRTLALGGSGKLFAGGSFTNAGGVAANRAACWQNGTWNNVGSVPDVPLVRTLDSYVYALALDGNGSLYAGGAFTTAGGGSAKYVAKWDGSAWSVLGSGLNGYVSALVLDHSGNLYAGGAFTMAGGGPANYVAKWDGSAWSALGSGVSSTVKALAVDGNGRLFAGGNFTTAGGGSAKYVAKWDGSAWSALGSGVNSTVNALAVDASGNLYAGGVFTTAGGGSANRIAKWDGSAWSALGSGVNSTVNALVVDGNGMLHAGGAFTTAGGGSAKYIAKWDGSAWSTLGAGLSYAVYALAVDSSGNLYVGGSFTNADVTAVSCVAKWDGSAWSALGLGLSSTVYALTAESSENLYAGGAFHVAGEVSADCIANWDGRSWSAQGSSSVGSVIDGEVSACVTDESGAIYVGGSFLTVVGVRIQGVAKWDGRVWSTLGTGPAFVNALTLDKHGNLYAAAMSNVKKWDGRAWTSIGVSFVVDPGGMEPAPGGVYALAVDGDGTLYAGGYFWSSGSGPDYIAKWSGSAWNQVGGSFSSAVYALAIDESDNLYVGNAGGIHKWDGHAWISLGSGVNAAVHALALDSQGVVYAGGGFTMAGGISANRIAKWDGSTWSALGSGVGSTVRALTVDDSGNLYAGGDFTTAGSVVANRVAKWDGNIWSALGSGVGDTVQALVIDGNDDLYVGGTFLTAGGKISPYLAKALLSGPGEPLAITTANPLAWGINGEAYTQQLVAAGGTAPYTWTIADGYLHGYLPYDLELSANGVISGTLWEAGNSTFLVAVTDSTGASVTNEFTLSVYDKLMMATDARLRSGVINMGYWEGLQAWGGAQPHTWTLVSGSLPAGLSLDEEGSISGTPTALGTSTFTARVTDAVGVSVQQAFTLMILDGAALDGLSVYGDTAFEVYVEQPFSPAFHPATTNYSVTVLCDEVSVSLTPAAGWVAAVEMRVNGGGYETLGWDPIPLEIGTTILDFKITAGDGLTSRVYTLAVIRAVSTRLAALALGNGTLTPAFAPSVSAYAASLPNDYAVFTATAEDTTATMAWRLNGGTYVALTNGVACQTGLAPGVNTLEIRATDANGATATHTVTATRVPGTVSDGFNPGAQGVNNFDGVVGALAVQADGKILVGGSFTNLAGQSRSRIGRLNADGTLDDAFNPRASGEVNAIAVQTDGKIVVGGSFTNLGGQARLRIGRLNPDGSPDASFTPSADSEITAIVVQPDGKIIIGGLFTNLNGATHNRIGRLNTDGSLDPAFVTSGVDEGHDSMGVRALALQPDGKILVCGWFNSLGGQPTEGLGRLNADGSLDTTFQTAFEEEYSLNILHSVSVLSDGKILAGGMFTLAGEEEYRNIIRLNGDGSADTSFVVDAADSFNRLALLLQPDGKILVGGQFSTLGGLARQNIGRLNADGTVDDTFNPGAVGSGVHCFAVQSNGVIVVGGSFTSLGGKPRLNIGRLVDEGAGADAVALPGGCVAWWKGETNYVDSAGGNHGTGNNGVTFAEGLCGRAFRLDGVNDFVSVATGSALNSLSAFTLEFWFCPQVTLDSQTPTASSLFNKGAGTFIGIANNDGRLEVGGPSPRPTSTTSVWLSNVWHHAAVCFDGGAYRLYVDGVKEAQTTSSLSLLNNTSPIQLGSSFPGLLDEVSVYNRSLSSNEVASIYRAGGAGKSLPGTAPSLAAQPQSRTNVVGTTAAFSVTATGTAPLTYQWRRNGTNVVNGGAVAGATSSALTVTSVQTADAGAYSVVVANPYGSVTSQVAVLTVWTQPSVTNGGVLPTGTVGVAYSQTLAASGGAAPYAWSVVSGNLPAGLSLSVAGVLSGSPAAGTFGFTARVTDVNGLFAEQVFSLTVQPSTLSITNVTAVQRPGTKLVEIRYDVTCATTNRVTVTLAVSNGVQAVSAVSVTGDVGTGVATGTGRVIVWNAGADWNGTVGSLTVVVLAQVVPGGQDLASSTAAVVDTRDYALTVASAHGHPSPAAGVYSNYCWRSAVTCAVEAAVLESATNWVCAGWMVTGSVPASGAMTNVVVTLTNLASSVAWQWTPRVPAVAAESLPVATVGAPYGLFLRASGGATPYTWVLVSGALPSGLSLSAAGALAGTPTAAGTATFTVKVADAAGAWSQRALTLVTRAGVPAAATFGAASPLSAARFGHTATLLSNGKVLVAGGYNDSTNALDSAELYDEQTGTWTQTGRLNTPRRWHRAVLLPDGRVLVTGGNGSSAPLASSELYDPVTGVWTITGPLGTARYDHVALLLPDGTVLVAGGTGSSSLSSSERYNPATGVWTTSGSLNEPRGDLPVTLLPNGKVLVAGGSNSGGRLSSSEVYDFITGSWTSTVSMGTQRYLHTATVLPNGKVLVAGGCYGSLTVLSTALLYDPSNGTWTATGSMSAARYAHSAALLPNGKVLVSGGYDGNAFLSSAEIYDPSTGTWSSTGALGTSRYRHTMTLLPSGRLLVVAGMNNARLSSAEVYEVGAGSRAVSGSLATARNDHAATLLPNGKVLVAGGSNNTGYFSSAELFDPAAGTWSSAGSMNAVRERFTLTLLPDGRVLAAGGRNSVEVLPGAEVYAPSAGTWTTNASMNTARFQHTATLLPDGRVLVAGGWNGSACTASAEVFTPSSGVWTVTGSLSAARYYHTATLLPNGKVLVAGGYNGSAYLASAEIYDPATGVWTAAGSLNVARTSHRMAVLPSGQVLVAGGENSGNSALASAEVFNPASGTWLTVGSLAAARRSFTLTVMGGVIVAAGGYSGSGYLQSVEVFDPASATWRTSSGSLATGRYVQTATTLPNGKVLIAGGYNGGIGAPLASAELLDAGLGYSAAWQPQVATCTSPLGPGGSLALTGARFRGLSGASGGNAQDSCSDCPVVQVRSLESGQTRYLDAASWTTNAYVSKAVSGLPVGWAMATVFVNGIPGNASLLSITDVTNRAPTNVTLSTPVMSENLASGTVVGTLAATDPDAGGTFTYALVSGAGGTDNACFTVVSNTLRTALALDYEAKSGLGIRVRVTDQGGLWFEKAFTVTVLDANESPTDLTVSGTTVAEHLPVGSTVGLLATVDPDAGNTFTYALVSGSGGADNASFTLDGNALETAATFDYESRSSYSVRLRTTDQGGLWFEKALAITVANVPEAPYDLTLSGSSVAENLPTGTAVGSLSTADPDAGDTFTYALAGGAGAADNASFTVSGNVLRTAAPFNFEVKSSYAVRLRTTDSAGLWYEEAFAVTVTDATELAPEIEAPERAAAGGGFVIRWSSLANQHYTVHSTTNLQAGFAVVRSGIPATPPVNCYTSVLDGARSRFWKVTTDSATNGLYLVVDLSGGPSAATYPVSYLAAPPEGGWTDAHKTTNLVLRLLPAATNAFTMGSPSGELGRQTDETQHAVTLLQGFYAGVFEVTQKQWERVMGTWPSYFNNAGYRDARPVEQVSYNMIRGASAGAAWPVTDGVDATSFLGLLRAKTGLPFDLPTESQWEYACRAGAGTALNSGYNLTNATSDARMSEVGRYSYNGGGAYTQDGGGSANVGSAQAGSYLPNTWGLYDMHGNVYEWCLDWYGVYPGAATDPKGASSGAGRVSRGGAWHNGADNCRSSRRNNDVPGGSSRVMGFRLTLPPGQP